MPYPGYIYKAYPRMISHPILTYNGIKGYTIVNSDKEESDVLEKIKGADRVAVVPDPDKTEKETRAPKGTGNSKKLMFTEG